MICYQMLCFHCVFLSFLSPELPKAVFSFSYLTFWGFGKDFERLGGWGGGGDGSGKRSELKPKKVK